MATLGATPLPQAQPVHIEIRHGYGASRLMYFWLTDLYTKEERKVKSEFIGGDTEVLDFELYHPLYAEIIPSGNQKIPFYVEPGDSIIIQVGKNGKGVSYRRKDGKPMKYTNLLLHDVSNRTFYTQEDFMEDKQQTLFPDFVNKVTRKMAVALDSVEHMADRYGFSVEERNLARCNVQMQFGLWIFEYEPYKASELTAYANQHEAGWQSTPQQDREMEAIQDFRNYRFMRGMPTNDSTVFASKFFPAFIQSYEHAQVINYDQYLYVGMTNADSLRMDSAFVAKDLAITQNGHASLFMEVALQRRHTQQPVNDGSVKLKEVQVIGFNWEKFYQRFGKEEYNPHDAVQKAWANDVNLKGILSSLINRKKIRSYKRAKKIIEKLGADDAEREALMKAYKESHPDLSE